MRCSKLLLLALAVFWLPYGVLAKPNLNPPYGDPAYRAFSVFSPDAASPSEYKEDVVIVLHGFMSAVPNGTFKRIRKKLLKSHTALGINYDPLDVEASVAFFDELAKVHLAGRTVTVVGTSLGGFWARYVGHRINAHRVVLLNPVVNPATHMRKYIGAERENRRRVETVSITAAQIDPYAKFDAAAMSGPRTLLIVTEDDDRVDRRLALALVAGDDSVVVQRYATGGHTINLKKHAALGRIASFVSTGE